MPLARALLDTDTLSAVMRGTPRAVTRAREYLVEHRAFSFSIITRYELLRGLKAKARQPKHRRSIASAKRA